MSKFLDESCIDSEATLSIPESDESNPFLQALMSGILSQVGRCDYSDIDNQPELDKLNKDI